MFGRRKARRSADEEIEDLGTDLDDELEDDEDGDDEDAVGEETARTGPWDADDDPPEAERLDLGCLLVPMADGTEVQVNVVDDQLVAATIFHGANNESAMQVQAFAAPKSSTLWKDVRREIITELTEGGGSAEETDGPFGKELAAQVPAQAEDGTVGTQPVRFLAVDGPRWFLRGVISGKAATDPEAAAPLEAVFADLVVVRGDSPMPPRDLLELRLPREAQQALEEQQGRADINPFERGPEITEVR